MKPPKVKKKTVLFVKKRRRTSSRFSSKVASPCTYAQKVNQRLIKNGSTLVTEVPVAIRNHVQPVDRAAERDLASQRDDEFFGDEIDEVVSCDTLQLMQSLQKTSPERCLPIPLSASSIISAVLECNLYAAGLVESIVARELADLLNSSQIRKLSQPKSTIAVAPKNYSDIPIPTILITNDDYCRGVLDAHESRLTRDEETLSLSLPQKHCAIDWFLDNLKLWTGARISLPDFERTWNRNQRPISDDAPSNSAPVPNLTLEEILAYLVEIQVLLPCYGEGSYQLWLPAWPMVMQTWSKTCTSLVAQLKRSQFKERSLTSVCKNKGSPIPMTLIVDYLSVLGKIEVLDKPAGKFLKLIDDH